MNIKLLIKYAVVFMIYCCFMFWLISCSSTKKTVSRSTTEKIQIEKSKLDSTARKTTDSSHVKKSGSTSIKKGDSTYQRVTEETEIDWILSGTGSDSIITWILPGNGTTAGRSTKQKVKERKKITWETGVMKTEISLQNDSRDSVSVKKTDTAAMRRAEGKVIQDRIREMSKDKKVIRISWWWLLLLLLVPVYKYRKLIIKTISPYL